MQAERMPTDETKCGASTSQRVTAKKCESDGVSTDILKDSDSQKDTRKNSASVANLDAHERITIPAEKGLGFFPGDGEGAKGGEPAPKNRKAFSADLV